MSIFKDAINEVLSYCEEHDLYIDRAFKHTYKTDTYEMILNAVNYFKSLRYRNDIMNIEVYNEGKEIYVIFERFTAIFFLEPNN